MTDTANQKMYDVARKAVQSVDNLIEEAIYRYTGASVDLIPNINDHLRFSRYPTGVECYCWDGEPILEVYPPTLETVREGDTYKIRYTQQYVHLFPERKTPGE